MKNLKSFENFSMYRDVCDRCKEDTDGKTIMSMLNTDVICMKCKEDEKNDPEYEVAVKAELDEVRKGNYNYKGYK